MENTCKCCGESCGCAKIGCGCSGYMSLVARVFLGLLFLVIGYEKITNFAGTVAAIASVGVPFPTVLAVLAILLEFGGAILLIVGFQARLAAWGLILFTAVATLMYHRDFSQPLQMLMALKNVSIIGGLLLVATHGPGKLSIRCGCGHSKCPDCGDPCACGKKDTVATQ